MELRVDESVVLAMLPYIKLNWVPVDGVSLLARAVR